LLLTSEEDSVAMRAIIDVLDRNGFKPELPLSIEWDGDITKLTDESR